MSFVLIVVFMLPIVACNLFFCKLIILKIEFVNGPDKNLYVLFNSLSKKSCNKYPSLSSFSLHLFINLIISF